MKLNILSDVKVNTNGNMVRFSIDNISTNWMDKNDSFIKRIDLDNLNKFYPLKHFKKEIEIKNILDEGINFLNKEKYVKAIDKFDKAIFYDENYAWGLLNKSYALKGQGHFVKSLRYYKRAIKADGSFKNLKYYKDLIKKANNERDNFPKLKLNIYAGDEHFSKGEYKQAVESYDKALSNPSKFKDKILSKLLNKKATSLLKLKCFDEALNIFTKSLDIKENDYAHFAKGICEYNIKGDVSDEFKGCLKIEKRQMLKQVVILNELEYFKHSLKISDYLINNTFIVNLDYFLLIKARINTLTSLGKNYDDLKLIHDELVEKYDKK